MIFGLSKLLVVELAYYLSSAWATRPQISQKIMGLLYYATVNLLEVRSALRSDSVRSTAQFSIDSLFLHSENIIKSIVSLVG